LSRSKSWSVSVVIPAYTEARWEYTCRAIESALQQAVKLDEIIVCVDHNEKLLTRLRERWATGPNSVPRITVIESKYEGRVAASRTSGLEHASSEFIVFLDDDAWGEVDWIERMLEVLDQPDVVAVGGAPLPVYERPRPRWLPEEFNWIFGCAYAGLPVATGPVLRVIGTTFAARRLDLLAVGGFRADVFEDMDISHRLLALEPQKRIMYVPDAIVRHCVHPDRLSWRFFVQRVFWVNRGKAAVMRELGGAANLDADRQFVARALGNGLLREFRRTMRGDLAGVQRATVLLLGIALAASAYGLGVAEAHRIAIGQRRRARRRAGYGF
jgi:glucosyl-dolichyl phosphate glucuronosyltransferase